MKRSPTTLSSIGYTKHHPALYTKTTLLCIELYHPDLYTATLLYIIIIPPCSTYILPPCPVYNYSLHHRSLYTHTAKLALLRMHRPVLRTIPPLPTISISAKYLFRDYLK